MYFCHFIAHRWVRREKVRFSRASEVEECDVNPLSRRDSEDPGTGWSTPSVLLSDLCRQQPHPVCSGDGTVRSALSILVHGNWKEKNVSMKCWVLKTVFLAARHLEIHIAHTMVIFPYILEVCSNSFSNSYQVVCELKHKGGLRNCFQKKTFYGKPLNCTNRLVTIDIQWQYLVTIFLG